MNRIAFLIPATDTLEDSNFVRFGDELTNRGAEVCFCLIDSLSLTRSRVTAEGWTDMPVAGELLPAARERYYLSDFDTIWVFSLGLRSSFLDKYQLLYTLGPAIRFVNSLDAIMHLKSKYFITSLPETIKHPETYASTDPALLLAIVESSNKTWVAKPPAGSLGRDVFLLRPGESNNRAILQHLCGHEGDQYTLIQEYIDDIANGEKRVLIAGGAVVAQYRRHAVNDHRTNLLQGAASTPCDLTDEESGYCKKIGNFLRSKGANYVGLDMVYPWIIEFNVINPGGLITIQELTGENLAPIIIDNLSLT